MWYALEVSKYIIQRTLKVSVSPVPLSFGYLVVYSCTLLVPIDLIPIS